MKIEESEIAAPPTERAASTPARVTQPRWKRVANAIPKGDAALPPLAAVLFVFLFIAWPLVDAGLLIRPLLSMPLLFIMLGALYVVGADVRFIPAIVVVGAILFLLQLLTLGHISDLISLLQELVSTLFVMMLCAILLRSILRSGRVTPYRIVGAVIAYLLMALQFAFMFALVERYSPGSFIIGQPSDGSNWTGWRFFYLSMITLSSLGLSDITPVHPFARSLVMIEALLGQLYTTVLLARLVSLEISHRLADSTLTKQPGS